MIKGDRSPGSCGFVTRIALSSSSRDMRYRLALRPLRRKTTRVASRTLTTETGVIHSCGYKRHKIGMTGVTGRYRWNMVSRFSWRFDPIVTVATSSRLHTCMWIGRRPPGCRVVTSTAGRRSLNMRSRLGQRIGTNESPIMASLAIGGRNSQ